MAGPRGYRMRMGVRQFWQRSWRLAMAAVLLATSPTRGEDADRSWPSRVDTGTPPRSGPTQPRGAPGHRLGPMPGSFSAVATVASEYVWRGVSQSNRLPAGQLEVDWRFDPGFYVGTWLSNVDFDDEPSLELDLFAGYVYRRGNLELDFGFIYYLYPLLDSDGFYPEVTLNATYDFGRVGLSGFFAGTWNYGEAGEPAYYPAIDARVDLFWTVALRTHVGYQFGNGSGKGADEFDWSVGLTASHWGFDARLAYIDTNRAGPQCGGSSNCDARAFFSLTRAF